MAQLQLVGITAPTNKYSRRYRSGLRGAVHLPQHDAEERLLTYREAEAIAGRSRDTMKRAESAGELEILRPTRRTTRIRRAELLRWISTWGASPA